MLSVLLSLACSGFFLVQRIWAQVGTHDKPSLSAWPSPIVSHGACVELQCDFHNGSATFKLYKEDGANNIPDLQDGIFEKSFLLGPVTTEHGGTYRCYYSNLHNPGELSAHSDPLEIIISGVYRKPSLSALPAPVVKSGGNVTLQCHSEIQFQTFIVVPHRLGVNTVHVPIAVEHHDGHSQGSLIIGSTTPAHAGTYICYGSFNNSVYEWSAPSDPIEIKITGLYKKPFLSAQLNPVMMSGENMTLSCSSDHQFHMFHLFRDGAPQGHGAPTVPSLKGTFQANFSLRPVRQAETYRCYGSFNNSPHEWSDPSDPVYLPFTVNSSSNCLSCTKPDSKTDYHKPSHVLLSVMISVSVILIFLICLVHRWYFTRKNKSQEEEGNAANTDQAPEVKGTVNRQDPERGVTRDVTYTELDHSIVTQKIITPSPKRSSKTTTVYMEVMKC